MFSTKILLNTKYIFDKILIISLIIFLTYCYNYPFTINSSQAGKIVILFVILLLIPDGLSSIINKRNSKLRVMLTPQQLQKVSEQAQKQNKSVDQFCIEAINEKLDQNL